MNSDSESLQQYLLGLLADPVNKHENSRKVVRTWRGKSFSNNLLLDEVASITEKVSPKPFD
jgi:hypothetical protein